MVKVITFGCRINAYESEVIKEKLAAMDDIIVINTCAVTGEAERQCRQEIRKQIRENPTAKIVVTGCSAQVAADKLSDIEGIYLILGNKEKSQIDKILSQKLSQKTIVGNIFDYEGFDNHILTSFEGRQRAFVQIQQGCNHRCTYCIVPFARGNNRSVPVADILAQIGKFLDQGFAEICLTGVDICSFAPSFSQLVHSILTAYPKIPSLQFGSLDPAAIDKEFISLIADNHNIAPHFHLSIQSGDNIILKRMKRRHNREDVINLCNQIRSVRPDATFGADFICGFPTETENQFANTLKLVDEAGISKLHVFPYSERIGTPAAQMPQIPIEERRRRAELLRQKGEQINAKLA